MNKHLQTWALNCPKLTAVLFTALFLLVSEVSFAQLKKVNIQNSTSGQKHQLQEGQTYNLTNWEGYYLDAEMFNNTDVKEVVFTVNGVEITERIIPYTFPASGQNGNLWNITSNRNTVNVKVFDSSDTMISEETYNFKINDYKVALTSFDYDETDNVIVEVQNVVLDRDGSEVAVIDNSGANVLQVVAEVIYKGGNPGSSVQFTDQDNNVYTANASTPSGSSNARVYRVAIPGNVSAVYYNENSAVNRLQSFVLNVFKEDAQGKNFVGLYTEKGGYNNISNIALNFRPTLVERNLEINVPISEMTEDGRYMTLFFEAGGVEKDTTIFGPDGACCLNQLDIVLEDVPAGTSQLNITVDTRNGQHPDYPGLGGQSWVLGASIFIERGTSTTLPVELSSFNAEAITGGKAELKWITASEDNNDRFEIERSFDGINFEKVGFVLGQGTTDQTTYYSFIDHSMATVRAAQVFYRLNQIDFDGTSAFSSIKAVAFDQSGNGGSIDLIVSNDTYRLIDNSNEGMDLIQVYSITGEQVAVSEYENETIVDLNTTNLNRGTYLIRINGQYTKKVVVR